MRGCHVRVLSEAILAIVALSNFAVAQDEEPQPLIAGVSVDAQGVLQHEVFKDPGGQLTRQRRAAARATLNREIAKSNQLRKISLTRLERAIRKQIDEQKPLTEEMRYLAGITRLQYVFFFPETKEIVIAGPAEGWMTDLSGRVRALETGRPVVELQDLIVALRAFAPGQRATQTISCSIDPTKEGLANTKAFLDSIGTTNPRIGAGEIAQGLRENMGLQDVSIKGIPATTHFAQVLVEADYRMKLIGIGLEKPPVKLASYVDLVDPAQVNRNAMQRWFFVPNYECVRVSEDDLAMELVGNGVMLINADELVTKGGERVQTKAVNKASKLFCEAFTKKFPEIADKSPVYAQLRNMIDLAVAAAFIQKSDFYRRAGWSMDTLRDESAVPVQTYNAPQRAATAVNVRFKSNRLMTPMGGGVQIKASKALDTENLLVDEDGKVKKAQSDIDLSKLPDDQWWWD